jgi:hypothetical protein
LSRLALRCTPANTFTDMGSLEMPMTPGHPCKNCRSEQVRCLMPHPTWAYLAEQALARMRQA